MAIDTLVFRDDGKKSYSSDPAIQGVAYCRYCKMWHEDLTLESGPRFCAFCYTTHHSRACRAGYGEDCPDPSIDPIHHFLTQECSKHQIFDLSFCRECNCFHSSEAWRACLQNHRPRQGWTNKKKLIWKMRWETCVSERSGALMNRERSLFNMTELLRIVPHEYPYSNGKFIHHCHV